MWPTPPCRSRVITSPFRTGGKTDSRSVRVDIWLCRLLGEEMKRFLLIAVFFFFFFGLVRQGPQQERGGGVMREDVK